MTEEGRRRKDKGERQFKCETNPNRKATKRL